jgi:chemotaxis protein MotB
MNFELTDDNQLKTSRSQRKKSDTSSWSLSYGDMVTALLCFFIIFYALEKQIEKNKAVPSKSSAINSTTIEEHKAEGLDTQYDYAIESLEKIPGIYVSKTSKFVDIKFRKTIFFKKGQTKLSQEGIAVIDEVMGRLRKIEGRYLLEIQGHADATPVKQAKARWWQSNMELSILRALTVHSYLAENYVEKDNLIVAGYGSQQKISNNEQEEIDMNRRISLRLQLVK